MASPRAEITPEVLKWARERARYTPSEAASKAGTTEERYIKYEEGAEYPTLKQLFQLAKAFRQSVETFYLDSPPDVEEPLKEMRRLGDTPPNRESSNLATAVEDVLDRRRNALDMFEDLGQEPPTWDMRSTLDDDPESIGIELRNYLGADLEEQLECESAYQALDYWRNLLAERGVLCFQIPRVSIEQMRGFAISKFPLPVVGINRKDSATARVFTLLHEVGHILLEDSILHESFPGAREAGTVAEEDIEREDSSEGEIERYCNEVAAATLIPEKHLLSLSTVRSVGEDGVWSKDGIRRISSVYNVSPSVAIRRLFSFGRISTSVYYNLVQDFDEYEEEEESSGGGGDYYRNQRSELGQFYSDLAFKTYNNGTVTLSELSSILGIKVDNISRYQKEVYS